MAIEIVSFPIHNDDFPQQTVTNYQRAPGEGITLNSPPPSTLVESKTRTTRGLCKAFGAGSALEESLSGLDEHGHQPAPGGADGHFPRGQVYGYIYFYI